MSSVRYPQHTDISSIMIDGSRSGPHSESRVRVSMHAGRIAATWCPYPPDAWTMRQQQRQASPESGLPGGGPVPGSRVETGAGTERGPGEVPEMDNRGRDGE